MDKKDRIIITYGIGYAFKKTKILGILEIDNKTIFENETSVNKEIKFINQLNEEFRRKGSLNFPKSYIKAIEEILDDELLISTPLIVSIKYENDNDNEHKYMNEYRKCDFMQLRFSKEGYIAKNLKPVNEYLDKKLETVDEISKHRKQVISEYDKLVLKLMLTSFIGDKFAEFINKNGQVECILDKDKDKTKEIELECKIKNNTIIKKNYSELDFLNLILVLEEWQQKHFKWDGEYTSLFFLIDKEGNRDLNQCGKTQIKDFMISFIKEKKYLYFPFARYNENNVLITLNDEKYLYNHEKKSLQRTLSIQNQCINENNLVVDLLDMDSEIGYLLSYKDEIVEICPVNYNDKNKEVVILNQYEHFKEKMLEVLDQYYIR